ncbi:triphosphoribosyl-dephospho-CoA synthase [Pelomicrobium methylotrophicum]|nr:triphosphoribosyl-dephospho-CoA synthase [Pelomicrobium methylotrophicum]
MLSMGERSSRADGVAQALARACIADVLALKPGNVSVYAAGHGMVAADFVRSAQAIVGPLTAPGLGVGARILRAVEATRAAVGCNTNLGIVLACAPLCQAALEAGRGVSLRGALQRLLKRLDVADAQDAYRAIRVANPGGLGRSERYDVRGRARVSLLAAMAEAQDRDSIARQYANGYQEVFELGVPRARWALARWESEEWAAVAIYLGLLARLPDTHVARKLGLAAARRVSAEAAPLEAAFVRCHHPEELVPRLLDWDRRLKSEGINPGTTADLTVASLFVLYLQDMLDKEFGGCDGMKSTAAPSAGLRSAVS